MHRNTVALLIAVVFTASSLHAAEPTRVDECLTNFDVFIVAVQVEALASSGLFAPSADLHPDWLRSLLEHEIDTVYVTLDSLGITPAIFIPVPDSADADAVRDLQTAGQSLGRLLNIPEDICEPLGGFVFTGSASKRDQLLSQTAVERRGLTEALAASTDNLATLIISWSPDQRRVLRELFPTLPDELGGIDAQVVAEEISSFQIAIPTAANAVQLKIATVDAASATRMADAVESWIAYAVANSGNEMAANMVLGMFDYARETNENSCTLTWTSKTPIEQLRPIFQQWFESSSRTVNVLNHLKQIGLALHNFHDAYGSFPPPASYVDGEALLSWRVYLLPYLDHAPLYQRFHLNEPWDSEHNMSLLAEMPAIYGSSNSEMNEQGLTQFVVPVADNAAFHGEIGVPIKDITDGSSNTALVLTVTAEHAVPWTKPSDWEVDFSTDLHEWLFAGQSEVTVLMGDGSVQRFDAELTPENLSRFLQHQDGEPVEW